LIALSFVLLTAFLSLLVIFYIVAYLCIYASQLVSAHVVAPSFMQYEQLTYLLELYIVSSL
jgi:hypothetical protein